MSAYNTFKSTEILVAPVRDCVIGALGPDSTLELDANIDFVADAMIAQTRTRQDPVDGS